MSTRPKIAFFEFTCCEGCQLTVVDSLQTYPELLDAVEIVQFREAMSEKGDDYQIAFIEGSCTRTSDESRLKEIRERAKIVVALGACAHLGGVNAIVNRQSLSEALKYVYGDKKFEASQVRPIEAVITVDAFIPGCPIDREEFIAVVKALLQGRRPFIPPYPVCVECKLKENECLVLKDILCLGSVVRAGCDALCTSVGIGCEGCRGLIPNPNVKALETTLAERGIKRAEIETKEQLFMNYQFTESEKT